MPAVDAILIDTGPIVASLDANDSEHGTVEQIFDNIPFAYTCWPVITEIVYLLGNYSKPVQQLFVMLRTRRWRILSLDSTDYHGIERILAKYCDQGFQLADACLMHLAEREGITQVITLDRKDFGLFRTSKEAPLQLLP